MMLDRLDQEDGISLVEVLVSVVIIGIALTAFAGTVTQSLANITGDEQHVRANQHATDQLDGLRGLSWDAVGFYADDPGYSTVAADGSETVTLGSTRPAGSASPVPSQTVTRDGINYLTQLEIVWQDDPNQPPPPAVDSDPRDYKELRITLTWTVGDRSFESQQVSVRQPTVAEVPLATAADCTPGQIVDFRTSPVVVSLTASGTTTEAISVIVETCSASAQVRLTPYPLAERAMSEVAGSAGTNWRVDDFPAGTTTFSPGTYTWTASATGVDGADSQDATIQFVTDNSSVLRIVSMTPSPSAPICKRSNNDKTYQPVTLEALVAGAADSDPVEVSWTGDSGIVNTASAVYNGPDGSGNGRWSITVPAGTRFRDPTTTVTVSVTRVEDGLDVNESYVVDTVGTNSAADCP